MHLLDNRQGIGWTEERLSRAIVRRKKLGSHQDLVRFLRNRLEDDDPLCVKNRAKLWTELGAALLQREEMDQAAECFRQTLRLEPNNNNALYNLGNTAFYRRDFAAALDLYGVVLQENPEHAGALYNSALSYALAGNKDSALPLFKRVAKVEPDYAGAHFWAGECLIHSGRYAEALPFFEKAYRRQPEHFESAQGYAIALFEVGRHEEVVALCDRTLASFGPALLPLRIKGDALLALDRVAEAVDCHVTMAEIDFDAREILVSRMRRLAEQNPERFRAYAAALVAQSPDFARILSALMSKETASESPPDRAASPSQAQEN